MIDSLNLICSLCPELKGGFMKRLITKDVLIVFVLFFVFSIFSVFNFGCTSTPAKVADIPEPPNVAAKEPEIDKGMKELFDPRQYHTEEELQIWEDAGQTITKFFVFPDKSAVVWVIDNETGKCTAYALYWSGAHLEDGRLHYRILTSVGCDDATKYVYEFLERQEIEKRKKGI